MIGWGLAAIGLPLVTVALSGLREVFALPTVLLLYLTLVVAVAAVGGLAPAGRGGRGGSPPTATSPPPLHEWKINELEDVMALVVFLCVAATVSGYVHVAARRAADAARAGAEADSLVAMAATSARRPAAGACVTARGHVRAGWRGRAATGHRRLGAGGHLRCDPPDRPETATLVEPLGEGAVLALAGLGSRRGNTSSSKPSPPS